MHHSRRAVNSFRVCTKCNNIFPLSEFYPRGKYKEDGTTQYKSWCKGCIKDWQRINRLGDKDMIRDELNSYEIETSSHARATVTYCIYCAAYIEAQGKIIVKLDGETDDTRCYYFKHKEIKAQAKQAQVSGSTQNPK